MAYDPKCEDLARYFLGTKMTPKLVADLAQTIQDQVETWLRAEIDERVESLNRTIQ
jgi:hypothetical protein